MDTSIALSITESLSATPLNHLVFNSSIPRKVNVVSYSIHLCLVS